MVNRRQQSFSFDFSGTSFSARHEVKMRQGGLWILRMAL